MLKNPKIIFEDKDLLVIDKPAGLAVHRDLYTEEDTLADWILKNYPDLKDVGEPLVIDNKTFLKPGIVHRLDKETSGVMVVAKTLESFENLKSQFQNSEVQKTYKTLVSGKFNEDKFIVDLPIGRSNSDPRKRVANKKASGKLREATTDFVVLEQFDGYAYLEAHPRTGRTHQIRVHLKAVQSPVLGDKLYGKEIDEKLGKIERQMLHAEKIVLKTRQGEGVSFEASLPDDFNQILEKLRAL